MLLHPFLVKFMSLEIERKFLVNGDFKSCAFASHHIVQGYLSSVPERNVRVRLYDNTAFLTIKGKSSNGGLSRYEWEKEIPANEAKELLLICEPGIIDKTRYLVKAEKHTYEIDEFHGNNEGLVIAEIELAYENESFFRPEWLGEEVTGDKKYYNSQLTTHPYTTW